MAVKITKHTTGNIKVYKINKSSGGFKKSPKPKINPISLIDHSKSVKIDKPKSPVKISDGKIWFIPEANKHKIMEYNNSINTKTISINNDSNFKLDCRLDNIVCCIFNHNETENSIKWLNLMNNVCDTFVLDSGSNVKDERFINFENIYYGGLINESIKIFEKGEYDFLLIITSDVSINNINFNHFLYRLSYLRYSSNLGVWGPSVDITSGDSWKNYNDGTSLMSSVKMINGFLFMINKDIVNKTKNKFQYNKFGYGIDLMFCHESLVQNKLNILDNNVIVHHPNTCGYDKKLVNIECDNFLKNNGILDFKDIAISNISKKTIITNKDIKYKNKNNEIDISFIIPLRGKNESIKHLEASIKKYFKNYKYEIIYVIQSDDKLFKRGQLANIGFVESNGKYVIIHDADVVHFREIDLEKVYKSIGPFCAFDSISQISINERNEYDIRITEKRINGWGACTVFSHDDFYKKNGFSNLCRGWGGEDNILEKKYNLHRIEQNLGHIEHPRLNNENKNSTEFNGKILGLYTENKINFDDDGFKQMRYNIIRTEEIKEIKKIYVDSISVTNKYKYLDLFLKSSVFDDRIIISLTSWEKRLNNLPQVLDNLLKQSVKPYKIIINLSCEEFPNKELDLPISLINFLKLHILIEINWVEKNTTVWKKIIPTLNNYSTDIIIGVDDEFIYPSDMLKTFLEKHKNFPENPISGNLVIFNGKQCHCGCASFTRFVFMQGYIDYIESDILDSGSSDIFYTFITNLNGFNYQILPKQFFTNMVSYNSNDGYSTGRSKNIVNNTYQLLSKKFGLNKPITNNVSEPIYTAKKSLTNFYDNE